MSRTDPAPILAIERPHPDLMKYYALAALVVFPLFPILVTVAWFRYSTMRYRFTDEGISMSWGILFRRETIIQYSRIQDIHLRSNVVERWFGLARVLVQTASGSADAEMTLEGLKQYEAVRDFLYSRMRGVGDLPQASSAAQSAPGAAGAPADPALAETLREVAAELRAVRVALEARGTRGGDAS